MEQLDTASDRTDVPSISGRLVAHEEKVTFLDAFAVLTGCREHYGQSLPDGRRPDVLRANSQNGTLFVGDAKHTEKPSCRETQIRLLRYLRWLSAHVRREEGAGVFAICFANVLDTEGWIDVISTLSYEAGLLLKRNQVHHFNLHLTLVLFTYDQRSN